MTRRGKISPSGCEALFAVACLVSYLLSCLNTTASLSVQYRAAILQVRQPNKFIVHDDLSRFKNRPQKRQLHLQALYNTMDSNDRNDDAVIMKEKNIFDLIFNPYESKIPKEVEKSIYEAEGNTSAAKDRTQRITVYAILAFTGVLCAFFNGFLTEIRTHPTPDGSIPSDDILDTIGFGWVYSNFIFSFLFTNKIGGVICLLGGGACGLLAEAEYDTRRINAEKIYEELLRRRSEKMDGSTAISTKKGNNNYTAKKGSKRRSGKEMKRMNALSEVAFDMIGNDSNASTKTEDNNETEPRSVTMTSTTAIPSNAEENDKPGNAIGIISKMKELYNQADTLAASQALLLNKELEEKGILPKITDETGLKVIGKDAASKIKCTNMNDKYNRSES